MCTSCVSFLKTVYSVIFYVHILLHVPLSVVAYVCPLLEPTSDLQCGIWHSHIDEDVFPHSTLLSMIWDGISCFIDDISFLFFSVSDGIYYPVWSLFSLLISKNWWVVLCCNSIYLYISNRKFGNLLKFQ